MPSDLTVDLIAAIQLTADSNDGTSNHLDFNNDGVTFGGGWCTYGASGLVWRGDDPLLRFGDEDLMFMLMVNPTAVDVIDYAFWSANGVPGGSQMTLTGLPDTPNPGDFSVRYARNDDAGPGHSVSSVLTPAAQFAAICWYTASDQKVHLQVNNGTAQSASATGTYTSQVLTEIDLQGSQNDQLRYFYFWKGVKDADDRSWLINGGAGRTYAEIAATHVSAPVGSPWPNDASGFMAAVHDSWPKSPRYIG